MIGHVLWGRVDTAVEVIENILCHFLLKKLKNLLFSISRSTACCLRQYFYNRMGRSYLLFCLKIFVIADPNSFERFNDRRRAKFAQRRYYTRFSENFTSFSEGSLSYIRVFTRFSMKHFYCLRITCELRQYYIKSIKYLVKMQRYKNASSKRI